MEVLQAAAAAVLRHGPTPGGALGAAWSAHFLLAARHAWGRGDHRALRRFVMKLPHFAHLFLTADSDVRGAIDEVMFGAALSDAMQTVLLSDLDDDLRVCTVDEQRRAVRARFSRRMAAWSPSRRRLTSLVVLDGDGHPCPTVEASGRSLAAHWGPVFDVGRDVDATAAERFLQHAAALDAAPQPLEYDAFCTALTAAPHSAPGPDGITYGYWAVAADMVAPYIFGVYEALCLAQRCLCRLHPEGLEWSG